MVSLGTLPGDSSSIANAVSGDGSVVVGYIPRSFYSEAFRWSSGTGMVGMGDLPEGAIISVAHDVSHDGTVIVGQGRRSSFSEAFRWTSTGGMVGLGDLPGGGPESGALGVSPDGSVVVGYGTSALGIEAYRWTSETGMIGLGDLPGGNFRSFAYGVSADGLVIVGNGHSGTTTTSYPEAFLWTQNRGLRRLADVLAEFGAAPTGLTTLEEARDVTVQGNSVFVVGSGSSRSGTQAYLATIPIVSASLANEQLNLTPASDVLALDVSATRLLHGEIGRYEFDFTTDGIYDLVLEVGTPTFDHYWNGLSESFLFGESDLRDFYPAINSSGFGSLSFATTVRMTHENGSALNTAVGTITFVPELGAAQLALLGMLAVGVSAVNSRLRKR
jgi:probable HAF family extracellular repeat protein